MTEFKTGDRVKVDAFEGELTSISGYMGGYKIRDDHGWNHEVYPHHSSPVTITKVDPPRPEHQIVRDGDGDVFIYEPDENVLKPWRLVRKVSYWDHGKIGGRYEDGMLTPPLTVFGE